MKVPQERATLLPNGLELCCPAEAGNFPLILAHKGRPGAPHDGRARRVSFSELLGGSRESTDWLRGALLEELSHRVCGPVHPATGALIDTRHDHEAPGESRAGAIGHGAFDVRIGPSELPYE